jgi:hypothetical protein
MPATSYVVAAWEALADSLNRPLGELPVDFRDVAIHQPVIAVEGQQVTLAVQLGPGGRFSVRRLATLSYCHLLFHAAVMGQLHIRLACIRLLCYHAR